MAREMYYDESSGQMKYVDNGEVVTGLNESTNPASAPTASNKEAESAYKRYADSFTNAGLTPTLDLAGFTEASKSFGTFAGRPDWDSGLANLYANDLYPKVAQQYNDAYKAYTKAQGGVPDPNMLMNTSYDPSTQGDYRNAANRADTVGSVVNRLATKAKNYSSITSEVQAKAEEDKKNEYKFVMPTEWQTIEDLANETVKKGQPTLSPDSVTQWEGKLEQAYAPTRNKLKMNMADYWASLFPQGGGSGRQAVKNEESLVNLETDKLNRAFGFAQSDLATQLANFQNAQNQLSGIGQFKAGADQFKSSQDAATAWNLAQLQWQKDKQALDTQNAIDAWNKQANLAQSLAELQKPSTPDISTTLLNSLAGGVGTAGGLAGMTKLLALLSSKDFKKNIVDNKIDSLEMIKGLNIKNFQYKGEKKQRIGVIAEDTPDLLTTDDKKALDIVNLFGVLLDAVKKLSIKLEVMELKNA